MKTSLRLLILALLSLASTFAAGNDADFAAVRSADQRRLAATIASDTATLASILSDELVYAHADGRVQTKPQFLAAVSAKKIRYLSVVPQDVALQTIVPGAAVAMHGRARLAVDADGRRLEFTLRFLAVWRTESDTWRLLSYQSSQLAEVPAAAK